MEIISYVALILLSLVGYSGGATGIAGKTYEPKPRLLDLGLILLIWGTALYSRFAFDLNKWLLILVWMVAGCIFGILSVLPAKVSGKLPLRREQEEKPPQKKNIWSIWKDFSMRMGSFQSRIVLSLFFFIITAPFSLITKIFADPLKLKEKKIGSLWVSKQETSADLEEFKRQF